jgi:FkbM family methyltransferase
MEIIDKFNISVKEWFNDKGDSYLRLNYPEINENSVVFDVGGYMGSFTDSIYTRYGCNVYVFEPVDEFYNVCNFKFSHLPKINVFKYGLSSKDTQTKIHLAGDASSISSHKSSEIEMIQLRDIIRVIDELSIDSIDLLKINIEGEEYNLMDRLISFPNIMTRIKNIQIQYHTFVDGAEIRRKRIKNILEKTHECNWEYDWVWENWKVR